MAEGRRVTVDAAALDAFIEYADGLAQTMQMEFCVGEGERKAADAEFDRHVAALAREDSDGKA